MDALPEITEADWAATPPSVRAIITALLEQTASLKAKVAELERRLGSNSSNSSKPPSSDPPWSQRLRKKPKSKKKQGGQRGHRKHERTIVPEAELSAPPVELKPELCPCCGEQLSGEDPAPIRHQVSELPVVVPIVTEHRLHALTCAKCGTRSRAKLPPHVPSGQFGPRAIATAAVLTGGLHLSRRMACRAMRALFGLKISLGMTAKFESKTAAVLAEPCEEIARAVAQAPVRHVDETPWPHGRRTAENSRKNLAWLWAVCSDVATVFRILPGRGRVQANESLGITGDGAVHGIIVSDRLTSYSHIVATQRQVCWAHLARNFDAMAGPRGAVASLGRALVAAKDRALALRELRRKLDKETFARVLVIEQEQLHEILKVGLGTSKAGMARGLLAIEPALWNFLLRDDVPATNNAAERALRSPVLWRKRSFGTMSETGARFAERMLTASTTLHHHGRSILEELTLCLSGNHPSLLPQTPPTAGA